MPNTNSQTIHQMGQAINAVVRQATGRDAVQNIDMDFVTVAQNKTVQVFSESIPYLFRRTGGVVNIGNARLSRNKVIGGTLAWNQLVNENAETVTPTEGHKVITKIGDTWNVSAASGAISITGAGDMIFDFTQMFGSAIADYIYSLEQSTAGAGVAWFRKYFPAAYYDYNAGELLSVSGLVSHDMTGFNQWDEQWEVGYIDGSTGENTTGANSIRSKNFCRCVGSTVYAGAFGSVTQSKALYIMWYDADKAFISRSSWGSGGAYSFGESPANACYFRIAAYNYNSVYKNDICINFSNPDLNGKYEPYHLYSYPLDDSLTLRGIPKLDSNNKLYYDGDTYEPDGTVTRRYGIVDLGTLTWIQGSTNTTGASCWHAQVENNDIKKPANAEVLSNLVCSKYLTKTALETYRCVQGVSIGQNDGKIYVYDDALKTSTSQQVATALDNVYLVYELATPTTETAEPFSDPQEVSPYGTEEYITTGIVPVGNETQYIELSDTNM